MPRPVGAQSLLATAVAWHFSRAPTGRIRLLDVFLGLVHPAKRRAGLRPRLYPRPPSGRRVNPRRTSRSSVLFRVCFVAILSLSPRMGACACSHGRKPVGFWLTEGIAPAGGDSTGAALCHPLRRLIQAADAIPRACAPHARCALGYHPAPACGGLYGKGCNRAFRVEKVAFVIGYSCWAANGAAGQQRRSRASSLDAVALQLGVERAAVDAEHFGGLLLVAVRGAEDPGYVLPFHFAERLVGRG